MKKSNLKKKYIVKKKYKFYNTIEKDEIKSVSKVMKSGLLSPFLGSWSNIDKIGSFYGGIQVNRFEKHIEKFFSVKHAITVNSWTSGLIAAVGSLDIEPGDEIITSPWTMCATATAIVNWMAIPIFADIDPLTFNIDPKSIKSKISNKTKAIIVPDIFGQSANISEINKIAKKYNLKVISDSAQSMTAKHFGKFAGTQCDIGGFSFNYHKHMQTGEGGVLITNDDHLAERMRLIRNHGEAVVEDKKIKKINNIIGYNFRMGEIEAAIGIEQLKKINKIISKIQKKAKMLNEGLDGLKGLKIPYIDNGNSHVYYYYALQIDNKITNIHRDKIYKELIKENIPVFKNYSLLHLLPMYKNKIAFGKSGYPWKNSVYNKVIKYEKGICPVAEDLNFNKYIGLPMCNFDYTEADIKFIISKFKKIWKKFNLK